MKKDPALEAYFAEGASWDADRAAMTRRSARIAWTVAAAGWTCAVASSAAIALLTPLKTVSPFVVRVDNTTGIVDVVPAYAGMKDAPEPLTRYLLSHYVQTCERFTWPTAEADYEECGSFHSVRRNQEWSSKWVKSNPESPLNRYKDGTTVRARVVSVSFFQRANGVSDLAQVRYTLARRSGEGSAEQISHHIATIQYAYVAPSENARIRQLNPLGFRVVDFRTEPETFSDPAATPSGRAVPASSGNAP